ncbi:oxidative phosphorylation uncoupler [Aureococcus anophagefferens]|nr:oxidative phosphorylation uncoupler [Aureococcus anophagefferens]
MPAGDVLNRHGTDASCDIPDPPKPTKPAGDALTRFCASATAAGLAESLTLPIDITKVRLQTSAVASGQLAIGREIVATEGVGALWKGVVPALFRQCSYTGLSLVLYEPVRNYIAGDVPAAELPFWKRVLAGGAAGGLSIFAVNPTDVVKARLQNSPESLPVVGTLKQASAGLSDEGLFSLAMRIPREEGFGAFYKGFWPLFQRKVTWTVIFFMAYEQLRAAASL